MSSMWGNRLRISLFGESHQDAVGITIDGLPPGIILDMQAIAQEMQRRAPGNSEVVTARKEPDIPEILSGVYNGATTGAPLCAIIKNTDIRPDDYLKQADIARPGHADFTAYFKYKGFNDPRGGGHFSGRLTAPIVFAGALLKQLLKTHGINIYSHILSVKDINDHSFLERSVDNGILEKLKHSRLALLNENLRGDITEVITSASKRGDSVGGRIECMITGVPIGLGEPFFGSVESVLSSLLFSIPGIKAVEFGIGATCANMYGSQANDEFYFRQGKIKTATNNCGGILGGITNGMPVIFNVAVKPTASIALAQNTVSLSKKENVSLKIQGRHDPCIVIRALPVVEAMAAIGIFELLKETER